MAKQKGWVNIHIHTNTNEIVASRFPYASAEVAATGIYIGAGVQKLGCFEVEWDVEEVVPNVLK